MRVLQCTLQAHHVRVETGLLSDDVAGKEQGLQQLAGTEAAALRANGVLLDGVGEEHDRSIGVITSAHSGGGGTAVGSACSFPLHSSTGIAILVPQG